MNLLDKAIRFALNLLSSPEQASVTHEENGKSEESFPAQTTRPQAEAVESHNWGEPKARAPLPDPAEQQEIDLITCNLVTALYSRICADISSPDVPVHYSSIAMTSPQDNENSGSTGGYYRFQASGSVRTLSVRGRAGIVEFFLLPVREARFVNFAEHPFRLRGSLKLDRSSAGLNWTMQDQTVTPEDVRAFLKTLIEELNQAAAQGAGNAAGRDNSAVRSLVLEKQNLVYKIVSQQEEIKTRLARDLHDTIIADLMMLKRFLLGDKRLSDEEIVEHLDEVINKLREICHDFAPRNLQDWGLKTSLQAMLDQMEERSGIDCSLICDDNVPQLPETVQLHTYRIIQEALNNIEKYASASRVIVTIELDEFMRLQFSVSDNGKGFQPDQLAENIVQEGGMGMGSMRERAELIRCFFPTNFSVRSQPGFGTTVELQMQLKPKQE